MIQAQPAPASGRKITLCLSPGAINVRGTPVEIVELAHRYHFDAVEPPVDFLIRQTEAGMAEFLGLMRSKGLIFGAAGLPVDFRGSESAFQSSFHPLPSGAAALQRAGIDRVATWLTPGHNELTYLENFRQHARRLRDVARVLEQHGQRLGLEYVGTPTSRQRYRYPFIHSMREMQELIAEMGVENVGFVLDSWHWWMAGENEADLLPLKARQVISVDLNDAPAGIPAEKQLDGQRELPCATGVIPLGVFLNALQRIGYDGPARAEPFNKKVNELGNEAACSAAMAALEKALALLRS